MSGNQAGSSKGNGSYKYNPAVEQIRTSFNQNSEVVELKAEVSRLKEELEKTRQALCISQPRCLELIDEFLEFVGADRQGITARQKINEALTDSQKQPRFSMLAKFRVWLESR
jgi:hypothetical protein